MGHEMASMMCLSELWRHFGGDSLTKPHFRVTNRWFGRYNMPRCVEKE